MSRGVNMVVLVGNVGADPEVRVTQGGSRIVKFSLATNRTWKDRNGQKQEATDWHNCTVFGALVDVVERYVGKGDRLFVRGRIEYSQSEYQGQTRYWTDIVVDELVMLGSSGQAGSGGQGGRSSSGHGSSQGRQSAPAHAGPPPSEPDDDLPF